MYRKLLTLCIAISLTVAGIAQTCIVAHYPFNGNALDETGNGHHGTPNGPALTADRFGNPNAAYSFDGVNDYIALPTSGLQNNEYSYSAWMSLGSVPGTNQYFCVMQIGSAAGNDQLVLIGNAAIHGNVGLSCGSWGVSGNPYSLSEQVAPTASIWRHVVFTRNSTEITLYVNGVAAGSLPVPNDDASYGSSPLATIGSRLAFNQYFHGIIDDVRIYDRVLSATEVANLHALESNNPWPAGALAHYPFNGNAADETGNGHHGTPNGAVLTSDRFGNPNAAYSFDGVNDYIALPTSGFQNNEYSYSAWMNLSSVPSNNQYYCVMQIGSAGGNDQLALIGNDAINGNVGLSCGSWGVSGTPYSVSEQTAPTASVWNHVVFTRTNTEIIMYVNGVAVDNLAVGNEDAAYGTSPLATIGSRLAFNQYFHGSIDDLRIYGRALSGSEVASLHTMEATGAVWPSGSAVISISTVDATCPGNNNGAATAVVSEGTAPYSYQWDALAGSATTATVSNLSPGNYSCTVTDALGCTASATATIAGPNLGTNTGTQLAASYCGATLSSLNHYIFCDAVAGAQRYQYEFLNTATNAISNAFSHSSAPTSTFMFPGWVSGLDYGTAYAVRVRVKKNGCWGTFGPTCLLTTPTLPTTQLAGAYCNTTLSSANQYTVINAVAGAQRYQYEITDGGSFSETAFSPSYAPAGTWFLLGNVPGVSSGTTYNIRVRVKIAGVWGAYGSACTITMPAALVPQIQAQYCGTTLPSINSYFHAVNVNAQRYQYEVSDGGSYLAYSFSYWAAPSSTWMSFVMVPGTQPGTTYSVRVRAKLNGAWGTWGPACSITMPAVSAKAPAGIQLEPNPSRLRATLFPNPAADRVTVALSGHNSEDETSITVYDMAGRLVHQQTGALEIIGLSEWTSGLYLLHVQVGTETVHQRFAVE